MTNEQLKRRSAIGSMSAPILLWSSGFLCGIGWYFSSFGVFVLFFACCVVALGANAERQARIKAGICNGRDLG